MDNFETDRPASEPDHSQLQAEVDSLRHLVVSIVVLLIVVSGTLNVFLLRQWRTSQTEAKGLRAIVDEYNKTSVPQITNFVAKLTEFGQTHTNFSYILEKYNLKPATTAATSSPPPAATRPPAKPAKK
jgi:hypothetical protein